MLLWKRDEQCISYYFPRFCLCAEQRAVDSDSADLQRAGFSELHLPDVVCRKEKGDGQVAGLYLVCYSVGRFVLEFFRGDLERGNVGSLSTSQFIAIFTAIAGVVLFFWFGKKKAQGPEKNIQEEKVV